MNQTREELLNLGRKQLQKLCKQHSIKATQKNSELVDDLIEYYSKEEDNLQKSFKKESDTEELIEDIIEVEDAIVNYKQEVKGGSLQSKLQEDARAEISIQNYTQQELIEDIIEVEDAIVNYKQEVKGNCKASNEPIENITEEEPVIHFKQEVEGKCKENSELLEDITEGEHGINYKQKVGDCSTSDMKEEPCDLAHKTSRKRHLEDENNETETGKKKLKFSDDAPLLKILVPTYAAGALIGTGGTNISEMQNMFGGIVRLSTSNDHYPGTNDRILIIRGEINEIIDLNKHIMEKVHAEAQKHNAVHADQIKIVLTNGAAGLLIGRGGLTIKSIQKESEAKISISDRTLSCVPGERVLIMSGSMDQRLIGCRRVIELIADEPSNVRNKIVQYKNSNTIEQTSMSLINKSQQHYNTVYPALSMSSLSGAYNVVLASSLKHIATSKLKTNVKIEVEVPDTIVSTLLGKQGQTIREFIQFSGAKIQISDKNEFIPGTKDRMVTITGDHKQALTAYFLINEKAQMSGWKNQ